MIVSKGSNSTKKMITIDPIFSFVTAGIAAGSAKVFIDFALSNEGKKIMLKRGMVPYLKFED